MNNFLKKASVRLALILLFLGALYLIIFLMDFGFYTFQPLGIVFKSLIYLVLGTFLFTFLGDIFSSIQERLKNLKLKEGKKRYWKEIIIYYLIAFTAITAYLSKSVIDFLLAMLVVGIVIILVSFCKNFKIARKKINKS